jgi:hypothetical protein
LRTIPINQNISKLNGGMAISLILMEKLSN